MLTDADIAKARQLCGLCTNGAGAGSIVEQAWDLAILARKALDTIDELRGQLENERWRDATMESPPRRKDFCEYSERVLVLIDECGIGDMGVTYKDIDGDWWGSFSEEGGIVKYWRPLPKLSMKERAP